MRKFYSEACEVIYEDALGHFEVGAISEAELREFEEICFLKEGESPKGEKRANSPDSLAVVSEHETA